MRYQSDPSSTLVLIAVDERDAFYWQMDNRELASVVRVVALNGWPEEKLRGSVVTACYYTELAARHRHADRIKELVEHRIASGSPSDRARAVRMLLDAGVVG